MNISIKISENQKCINTCYGPTLVWIEKNCGSHHCWIEYHNEYGYTTQRKVSFSHLQNLVNEA